jgi:antitoxin (DNA-binding transcriptional repressor) of toxin-antitoxin stability system
MKTLQLNKTNIPFSNVLKEVENGNEIVISYDDTKEAIAVIVPYQTWKKTKKRELGTLKGKTEVTFATDFSMTDEELLSS